MNKIFMTAREVQDFLEVSRTTAYQLIAEMNTELQELDIVFKEAKLIVNISWKNIAMAIKK